MTETKLQEHIQEVEKKLSEDTSCDIISKQHLNEITRAKIGRIFVLGFFVALISSVFVVVGYNIMMFYMTRQTSLFLNLENIIPLIGSVIGTPLGFVMGYYFKNEG